jgi:hypothetical protein
MFADRETISHLNEMAEGHAKPVRDGVRQDDSFCVGLGAGACKENRGWCFVIRRARWNDAARYLG